MKMKTALALTQMALITWIPTSFAQEPTDPSIPEDSYSSEVDAFDQGDGDDLDHVIACHARNAQGEFFTAYGYRPRPVQRRALNHCRDVSAFCRPLGCQKIKT
jgi:hypothetical protein